MSIASRRRQFNKIDWKINTEDAIFHALKELELGKQYPVKGVFITPDRGYGLGGVIITGKINDDDTADVALVSTSNEAIVNIIKDIMNCEEDVAQIMDGKCAFKTRDYKNKQGKTCYDIDFIDL